ncbi:MAG: metallophosphoesterase [Anaerovoracaceae bacterium]|jgi:predicted MPP superfamily phosphohydrolase
MFQFLKFFLRLLTTLIICSSLVFLYAHYVEPYWLTAKEVEFSSPHISATNEGIRIAALADTHFGNHYSIKDFEKVLRTLEGIEPDLVIFLGDLIDDYREYIKTNDVGDISKALSRIEAPYGKFAVFGNHDYGGGAHSYYKSIMEEGGFTVLINENITIEELGVQIIGIDDMLFGLGDPIHASSAKPDYFSLLLCHEPDIIDGALKYHIDLMLSGHTHGRQINLKIKDDYFLPPYGKKYVKGLYSFHKNQASLYVNPGIGMTQLPLRFMSPPEITVVTLKKT